MITSVQPTSRPTVVFHVGAHKTATTHLQHSIIARRLDLWDAGIRTMMPMHLRGEGQSLQARFDLPINRAVTGHAPQPEIVRAHLTGQAHRLVISEENFIGVLQTRKGSIRLPLYPKARMRLGMLVPLLAPQGVDLCFAVRDPATFLNSAYSQVLMSGLLISVAEFKADNPLGAVDWVDVIERLRTTPGVNSLTVWRYEDYNPLFGRICETLLGPDGVPVSPLMNAVHGGLSAAAVARVFERAAIGESGKLAVDAREALPVGADLMPFDAFTPEEKSLSSEFYQVQMLQIAAMDGVTVLFP